MAVEIHGNQIRIPQGDTGPVKFVVSSKNTYLEQEDRGVFTLARRGGGAILRKILTPDIENNLFYMMFTYEDTATLRPDEYLWSFKVTRNGEFDEDGRLEAVQEQHTAVLHGRLKVLATAGGSR